jgi:hypothetical protein
MRLYFPRWLEWIPEIHIEGRPVELPEFVEVAEPGEEERALELV